MTPKQQRLPPPGPMSPHEAYRHLLTLRRCVRKCYVARIMGMPSAEGALLVLEAERLLMVETENGWVQPLEAIE